MLPLTTHSNRQHCAINKVPIEEISSGLDSLTLSVKRLPCVALSCLPGGLRRDSVRLRRCVGAAMVVAGKAVPNANVCMAKLAGNDVDSYELLFATWDRTARLGIHLSNSKPHLLMFSLGLNKLFADWRSEAR